MRCTKNLLPLWWALLLRSTIQPWRRPGGWINIVLVTLSVLTPLARAGQSLNLVATSSGTLADPSMGQSVDTRVEFQLHNFVFPAAGVASVFTLPGTGVQAEITINGLHITPKRTGDNYPGGAPCTPSPTRGMNYLFRIQRDHSGGTTGNFTCEMWTADGAGYTKQSIPLTTLGTGDGSGGSLGGSDSSLGFLRVCSTLVALNSKPPTTADGCNVSEWKFDGNLTDSSGQGHTATYAGATYMATPGQTAYAKIQTFNLPVWATDWVSMRAGFANQLDGRSSFSMNDASSTVTYFWQQLTGPSTVIWANRTAATPTITGLIFGSYTFSLQVADMGGNKALRTLQVGAVAYDNNGVVIPSDPKVSSFFGPQIAFGQNPWGYEDERNLYAINAQIGYQAANYDSGWSTPGQGTVSYPFAGKGFAPGPACTTLSGGIGAADMSIAVTDASCLSLSSLPTWILIGGPYTNTEMVRICSTTGTSGAATLTACYDGRGMAGNNADRGGHANTVPAQTWPNGTSVGEMRIQGTGTLFSTDADRPICPAGLPGPPGSVVYSTGTVTLTAGSTTLVGSGTTWTSSNKIVPRAFIRVAATHASGAPFVFWAQIVTVTDATHLVINRPAPTGVDGSAFNYKITSPAMYLSLEFAAPDGHIARVLQNGVGCESETAMFALLTHDIPALDSTVMTGVKYSYKKFLSLYAISGTTSNFYGVGLAARNFYYRSGYGPALALANSIDEYAPRDPEIGDGIVGGAPLSVGGIAIGGFADLILNRSTVLTWPNVEQFARSGQIGSSACNATDSRDGGYVTAWLTLAANYDTNSNNRAAFKTALASVLTRDQGCKRNASDGYTGAQVNSFSHSFLWAPSVALTLTNGSTAVTGSGFTAGMCAGVATGTIAVTTASASATVVSGSVPPQGSGGIRIYITDTISNPVYVGAFEYSISGSSVSLAGIWPGASGTFSFMVENNTLGASQGVGGWVSSIWTDNADNVTNNNALSKAWACQYNGPASLTLNRAWDGPSGSNYHLSSYTVGTFGQQPFMLGVKTNQIVWASQSDDPAISAGYANIAPLVGNWMATYGFDSNTKGTFYNRVFGLCEPFVTASGSFTSIHGWDPVSGSPACGYSGLAPGSATIERINSAESGVAMIQYYLGSPSLAAKSAVDQYYGAVFGYCPYTTGGLYCDSNYVNAQSSQLSNGSLSSSKWPGFFFGMGGFFTNSWPAVRNGVQPARNRTVDIVFNIGSAASIRVTVTSPSGLVSTVACSATPCAISVDDRQGSHWYRIQHLSGTGQILSTADPVLLPLAPQP